VVGRHADELDALYLFACYMTWEREEDPSAGWELIAAAQSRHSDARAQARALLAASRHLGGIGMPAEHLSPRKRQPAAEDDMNTPYGLNIIDNCAECTQLCSRHFCNLSQPVLYCLTEVSHKSALPAGAILFVEGQTPRGMFIICSGRVNLSTTSKEGKILILKGAEAGEALGLSATISGTGYETTAETATPCVLNFIERKHFLELIQNYSEIGMHAAQCLSRDYQSAYRDIHDLVLTRSSRGKLARLLLSQALREGDDSAAAGCRPTPMTHEEMAMRIGASRETVTRLLTTLRRKRLIRVDGPTLVIRDRTALEALAV
jgi:CRP/FNR family cyclic AMP-dependent transcriptional regulator